MGTPSALLSLVALPVAAGDDPQLRPGTHLRWTSHAALGLPAAPVEVTCKPLAVGWSQACPPRPLVWTRGTTGAVLSTPFTLAAGEAAIGRPTVGGSDAAAIIRITATGIAAQRITGGVRTDTGYRPVVQVAGDGRLAATGLDEVCVEGPGTVDGAWWHSLACLIKGGSFEPVEHVAAPFGRQPRYDPRPVSDPDGAARARVRRGAPLRAALYDAIGRDGPAAPPSITPAQEESRVAELVDPDLRARYQRLFSASTVPPFRRTSPEAIVGADGAVAAELQMPLMFFLHAALQDPSVARWAGHATLDERPLAPDGHLYRIRTLFDPRNFDAEQLDLYERWLRDYRADRTGLALSGTGVLLDAYALALPGAAPLVPVPEGDARTERWIGGGPAARRLATLTFGPSLGAARYAIYRRGAETVALNPLHRGGRFRLPILPDVVLEPDGAARVTYHDPAAPAEACTYGIAVGDVFGRWSAWSAMALAAVEWLPLPVPVPEAVYRPVAREPLDAQRRAGRVAVTISLPARLPPGVPGLSAVDVTVKDAAGTVVHQRTVRVAADAAPVALELRGPALGRAETARVEVSAQFRHGESESETATLPLLAVDPRPPLPVTHPPRLRWATRPDAQDRSLARLTWEAAVGHAGYRVYRANTRTIESHLRTLRARGRAALTALREPLARPADVVAILDPFVAELPREVFELLTPSLVEPHDGRQCVLETPLPGRSRLVYLYRICAVAANQVEEEWSAAVAGCWFAIPASVRPQPPQLVAGESRDTPGAIRLIATVTRAAPVGALRILRTADPARAQLGTMAIVHEAPLAPPAADEPRVIDVEYLDQGAATHLPRGQLRPWSRYTYRAQVQAAAAAGEPEGVWSDLSQPASAVVVPDAPPPAPALKAVRDGDGVRLTWTNRGLDAPVTALGAFTVRVLRAGADRPIPQEIARMRAAASQSFLDAAPGADARYWVELRDPAGRRSASGVAEV